MGKTIVPLEGAISQEEARGWEGKIFRQVCEQGHQESQAYLEELEEALYKKRPAGWVNDRSWDSRLTPPERGTSAL
jgi:hypothetical protein